jgi:hypothetical protein
LNDAVAAEQGIGWVTPLTGCGTVNSCSALLLLDGAMGPGT